MSEVILIKTEDGRLDGLGEKGGRAWRRFRAWVASMEAGDIDQMAAPMGIR